MKFRFFLMSILIPAHYLLAAIVSGAEYRTIESYLYGRFEVRMKSAQGSGIISSFFTYSDESYGAGNWNEIDIELLGKYPDRVQFNYITGKPGLETHHTSNYFEIKNTSQEFHTYAFEWYPDSIVWYVNRKKVRSSSDHVKTLMTNAQRIMVNIWASTDEIWVGAFDKYILPKYAFYDYIAYSAYTPGSGPDGSDFTFKWKDDFDKWDQSRWTKSTHSWNGNYAQFNTKNISFVDSSVILGLTLIGAEGSIPISSKKTKVVENIKNKIIIADKNGLTINSNAIDNNGIVTLYTISGELIKTLHIEKITGKIFLKWNELDISANSIICNFQGKRKKISEIINVPATIP